MRIITCLILLFSLLFISCDKNQKHDVNCEIGIPPNFDTLAVINFYNYETEYEILLDHLRVRAMFHDNGITYLVINDFRQKVVWFYNLKKRAIDYEISLAMDHKVYNPIIVDVLSLDSIVYFEYGNIHEGEFDQFLVLTNRDSILKRYPLDYPKTIHQYCITEQGVNNCSFVNDFYGLETWSQYGIPGHNSDSLMEARELVYLAKINKDTLEYQKVPLYGRNYRNRKDGWRNFEQGVKWFYNQKLNRLSIYYATMDTLYHYDFKSGQITEQAVQPFSLKSIPMVVPKKSDHFYIMENYPYILNSNFHYCAESNRHLRIVNQFIFDQELQKQEGGAQRVNYIEFLDSDFNFEKCIKLLPNQIPNVNNYGVFIKEINYEKGLLTIYKYHP